MENVHEMVKECLQCIESPEIVKLVRKDVDMKSLRFVSFKVGIDPKLKETALSPTTRRLRCKKRSWCDVSYVHTGLCLNKTLPPRESGGQQAPTPVKYMYLNDLQKAQGMCVSFSSLGQSTDVEPTLNNVFGKGITTRIMVILSVSNRTGINLEAFLVPLLATNLTLNSFL